MEDANMAEYAAIDSSVYKHLFRSMQDGLAIAELICDEKGQAQDYRFLDANPAFEKDMGLTKTAIVGSTASSVFHGVDLSWVRQYYAQTVIKVE